MFCSHFVFQKFDKRNQCSQFYVIVSLWRGLISSSLLSSSLVQILFQYLYQVNLFLLHNNCLIIIVIACPNLLPFWKRDISTEVYESNRIYYNDSEFPNLSLFFVCDCSLVPLCIYWLCDFVEVSLSWNATAPKICPAWLVRSCGLRQSK